MGASGEPRPMVDDREALCIRVGWSASLWSLSDDGDLEVQVHDAEGECVAVREQVPLPLGQWQYFAFVVDGQTLRLGRQVALTPCNGLTVVGPRAMGVGAKLNPDSSGPDANIPASGMVALTNSPMLRQTPGVAPMSLQSDQAISIKKDDS